MIWRELKFILLHIPRTGGTTIEQIMSDTVGNTRRGVEKGEGFDNKHIDAERAEFMWDRWFSDPAFTVATIVRNPLTLVASQFMQNHDWAYDKDGDEQIIARDFQTWLKSIPHVLLPTSAEVDDHIAGLPGASASSAGESQSRFLRCSKRDEIRVMRFEDYKSELKELFYDLGIPNTTRHKGNRHLPDGFYEGLYDDESEAIVKSRMAIDFEEFGYTGFDT